MGFVRVLRVFLLCLCRVCHPLPPPPSVGAGCNIYEAFHICRLCYIYVVAQLHICYIKTTYLISTYMLIYQHILCFMFDIYVVKLKHICKILFRIYAAILTNMLFFCNIYAINIDIYQNNIFIYKNYIFQNSIYVDF